MRKALSLQLLMCLCGCASSHTIATRDDTAHGSDVSAIREEINIVAYTTEDGVRREFNGTVRLSGETYTFKPYSHTRADITVPRYEVRSFETVQRTDASGLAAVLATVSIVILGAMFAFPLGLFPK
jgi:hypothetical protein